MSGVHIPAEVCRDVVETVESLHARTGVSRTTLLKWAGLHRSRYGRWRAAVRECRESTPATRSVCWQLLPDECTAILDYDAAAKREGRRPSYRLLTYEMLDKDVVACSESTTYRVLKEANRIQPRIVPASKKGTGFDQPSAIHEHWHIDISYLWEFGHRAYLISVLEGKSRHVLHHRVMTSMTTGDVERVLQRARELYPGASPSLISDNGSQFVSVQFKGFLADCGYQQRRTAVSYPQSNGKMERQFRTTKEELRLRPILDFDDLVEQVNEIITHYNTQRYHSAIGYVTPQDVLEGRDGQIKRERRAKLEEARDRGKHVHSFMFN